MIMIKYVPRYSVDQRLELVAHWQLPSEESIGSDGRPSLSARVLCNVNMMYIAVYSLSLDACYGCRVLQLVQ